MVESFHEDQKYGKSAFQPQFFECCSEETHDMKQNHLISTLLPSKVLLLRPPILSPKHLIAFESHYKDQLTNKTTFLSVLRVAIIAKFYSSTQK